MVYIITKGRANSWASNVTSRSSVLWQSILPPEVFEGFQTSWAPALKTPLPWAWWMVYLFIMGKSIGESDVNFFSDNLFIIFLFIVLVQMVVPGEQRVVVILMLMCLGLFCSGIFSLRFCIIPPRRQRCFCYGDMWQHSPVDDVVVESGSQVVFQSIPWPGDSFSNRWHQSE